MSKIRINELARQLEIPSHTLIDMLPEFGITEKKTHSSSIDDSVAEQVRKRLAGGELASPQTTTAVAVEEPPQEEQSAEPVRPAAIEHGAKPAPAPAAEPAAPPAAETSDGAVAHAMEEQARPKPAPIRPPLATGGSAPLHPPIRPTPIPARPAPPPAPGPRPGQILSGPRQPLPPPPPAPAAPAAPVAAAPATPATPATPAAPATPGTPAPSMPLRQTTRPTLAGQPATRPVVPPRPDMVARLQQTQTRPSPGQAQPQAPRPGMPTRSATPVPGQPIYRGPIRPGQPVMRGPGVGPGGSVPGLRRPRTLHPTSPLRAEPATPLPTEQQRRHAAKPGGRDRHRDVEQEEGRLRMPVARRQEPAAPPPIDREITISEGITVKELSEKLGIKANLVIKKLVEKKIFATINQNLDVKMAEEIAREFGASTNKVSFEEESTQEIELTEESSDRVRRAPVVTIMGHVDHGKTSLLDAIRSTNVADREAGGITQHIGAYHIEKNGRKIVFIDTPGHEAFTRMRARGAKVTDIVVLVVAADDGVMPQTLEAIDHAKAAGVPIIVAVNKIDKGDAQPERVKQQLADRGLLAEDWGGDTVMVPVSARAKTNLDLLLEMILLVADLQDLKANPDRPAVGTVLEAELDRGRGPVATVIVRNGTFRVGDYFICGSVFGKVRAMFDDRGQPMREAEPSMPAEVLGLDALPEVGDTFQVVTDTAKAKQIVLYRESKARDAAMSKTNRITLEQLHEQLKEGEVKELNVILKTDVSGTAEVLSEMMQKLSNDKVRIRVLHSGVGAINETDVLLASASNAIVIGFNVRPERNATALAEQEKVDVRLHTIIYELTDELKRAMTGMLEPVFKEVYQGRAEIREVFRISKVGNVAGCMVLDGTIKRDSEVRILRDNVVVFTGKIESLKRFKNDASEVKSGFECGLTIRNFADVKPGDVVEAFTTERVAAEVMA
ncbi:MAG TPA: translation initiation factor IF-2 [Bryobacteraceae bacterium]|nr:translation initiation factor IF-2 [Bryobacteraceae bacterium]